MRKLIGILCFACMVPFFFSACGQEAGLERQTVRIAMPQPAGSDDPETNYYKIWLEEQSGLSIELEYIAEDYIAEYMRLLFSTDTNDVDAIFLGQDHSSVSRAQIEQYGKDGHILPLEEMIEGGGVQIGRIFQQFPHYDLKQAMTAQDGHIYFMPNLEYSNVQRNAQAMWINSFWLKAVGASIPRTTEDLQETLLSFRDGDPNGNGLKDDIPLAGTTAADSEHIVHFLLNSFIYTDWNNGYLYVEEGVVKFAPTQEAWREGLLYCRGLYLEGLLPEFCFTFDEQQLRRLVNDPRDLTGAFVAGSITDVLYPGSPELLSRYIHIPPLMGPEGMANTTVYTSLPVPGGMITSACEDPEAVFRLMDLMLSEEAYLIAAFGEQGVDWHYSGISDIGLNGQPAVITVKSHEWDLLRNKHFAQIGPYVTHPHYGDGIAWNGYQSDQRYLDARAARIDQAYEPEEYITVLAFDEEQQRVKHNLETQVKAWMVSFITGETGPEDEALWQACLDHFAELGLEQFTAAAQDSYEQLKREQ